MRKFKIASLMSGLVLVSGLVVPSLASAGAVRCDGAKTCATAPLVITTTVINFAGGVKSNNNPNAFAKLVVTDNNKGFKKTLFTENFTGQKRFSYRRTVFPTQFIATITAGTEFNDAKVFAILSSESITLPDNF